MCEAGLHMRRLRGSPERRLGPPAAGRWGEHRTAGPTAVEAAGRQGRELLQKVQEEKKLLYRENRGAERIFL